MSSENGTGLHNLTPPARSKRPRKIIGRGQGSGYGGTSTKGHKGQNSRSGGRRSARFEGGQMPIYRRLPKRGFTNTAREVYQVINIKDLERFDGEVTTEILQSSGLNKSGKKVKILGDGEIQKTLTVHASKFSTSAVEKIEKAGGKVVIVK